MTCSRVAWNRPAVQLPREALERLTRVVTLGDVPEVCRKIVQGRVRGRVVVDVNR